MGRIEKLVARMRSAPKDFTWDELKKVLAHYGYYELSQKGRTSGSRRKFVNDNQQMISLHEPHPQKTVKPYVLKLVLAQLNLLQ